MLNVILIMLIILVITDFALSLFLFYCLSTLYKRKTNCRFENLEKKMFEIGVEYQKHLDKFHR